jgi:hypothetical protein
MENFTIHIFGYGETQINSKDLSVKVKTTELAKVQPLVNSIWSKKPEDSDAEQSFHVIHFFGYDDVRYGSKDGFSLKNDQELKPLIDELIEELETFKSSTEEISNNEPQQDELTEPIE